MSSVAVSYCVSHKGFGHLFDEISLGTVFNAKEKWNLTSVLTNKLQSFSEASADLLVKYFFLG